MKIAIIGGAGKMGRWCANFLINDGHEIIVADNNLKKLQEIKRHLGVEIQTNINAVKHSDIVILAVLIDDFEAVAKEIGPYIRPEQIIIEITSVKAFPVEMMHKYIKTDSVLGIHPMFGPGVNDINKQKFILTPTNERETDLAQKVSNYLKDKGARVELMSPGEHDELMTVVLGLCHFIAIISADTLLSTRLMTKATSVGGTTYKNLLTLAESVLSEDPEFYASLQMNLPHIAEVETLFKKKVQNWAYLIKEANKQKLIRKIRSLKEAFALENPGFSYTYKGIYKNDRNNL